MRLNGGDGQLNGEWGRHWPLGDIPVLRATRKRRRPPRERETSWCATSTKSSLNLSPSYFKPRVQSEATQLMTSKQLRGLWVRGSDLLDYHGDFSRICNLLAKQNFRESYRKGKNYCKWKSGIRGDLSLEKCQLLNFDSFLSLKGLKSFYQESPPGMQHSSVANSNPLMFGTGTTQRSNGGVVVNRMRFVVKIQ